MIKRSNTSAIDHRNSLWRRIGLPLAGLIFLAGCASNGFAPRYLSSSGVKANFQAHLGQFNRIGELNQGGVDLTMAHGAPLVSPVAGRVRDVKNHPHSGNVIQIDSGVVWFVMAHMDQVFVTPGMMVDRETVIGTEGRTGKGARRISHVHVSVFGNGALHDLGPDKEKLYPRQGFVLDPDRLTGNGKTLIRSPWSAGQNSDKPYQDYVDEEVAARIKDLADKWQIKVLKQVIGPDFDSNRLYRNLHRLWILDTKFLAKEPDSNTAVTRLRGEIKTIFEKSRTGANKISLTSPYINHQSPGTIRRIMDKNPTHRELIQKYYQQYLQSPSS